MGGKRLKFPKRKKYTPPVKETQGAKEETPLTQEEHEARIKALKEMGLIK